MWLQSGVVVVSNAMCSSSVCHCYFFSRGHHCSTCREKKKLQNTAQPEVYLSLNRSLANRLLTAESTYFEKERVACLFCCIMVVSSATGKGHPLTSRWHLSLALGEYHCAAEDDGYKPDREDVVISRC